jgi:hypothetical protein
MSLSTCNERAAGRANLGGDSNQRRTRVNTAMNTSFDYAHQEITPVLGATLNCTRGSFEGAAQ